MKLKLNLSLRERSFSFNAGNDSDHRPEIFLRSMREDGLWECCDKSTVLLYFFST